MGDTKDRDIDELSSISKEIVESYTLYGGINHLDEANLPSKEEVIDILEDLLAIVFPGYFGRESLTRSGVPFFVNAMIDSLYVRLCDQVEKSLDHECRLKNEGCTNCRDLAERISKEVLSQIPKIREFLKEDVEAAYEGDPAAKSHDEIILSYPCVVAIATYRIAHELYVRGVQLIPRIMSEWAHSATGIDIHPGARIGRRFFIDHGTGVVIGETTEIGDNVKIYQGVTLGALSFRKDAQGRIVKGGKRHPTIEDDVTIYSGATILGGDTVIGKGSVVGGNVWLTSSIPPGTKVTISTPKLEYRQRKGFSSGGE